MVMMAVMLPLMALAAEAAWAGQAEKHAFLLTTSPLEKYVTQFIDKGTLIKGQAFYRIAFTVDGIGGGSQVSDGPRKSSAPGNGFPRENILSNEKT